MIHYFKLLFTSCILSTQLSVSAASITNGNFENCDFNGWRIDTDAFGDIGSTQDFTTVGSVGNCAASINVDYFSSPGDALSATVTEAFFANTLFQTLDLSGAANSRLMLDIEIETDSETTGSNPAFIADYFLIGLLNTDDNRYYNERGELGFLMAPMDINGRSSRMLSFELDSSYLNQSNWTLDFQVNIGFDDFGSDAFGSQLLIKDVRLSEVLAANAPAHIVLFALGTVVLVMRARRSHQSTHKPG